MARRVAVVRRQKGVTLLELLVVLAILAFMTTIAMFNMPPSRGSAKEEAERFAARMRAAEQIAIAQSAAMRVDLTAQGYQFMQFDGEEWRALDAPRIESARVFPKDVAVVAEVDGTALANEREGRNREEKEITELDVDPIGMAQAYTVVFSDRRESWRVSGGAGEGVKLENDAR